jgi:sporulation integral membrane protein YtvI
MQNRKIYAKIIVNLFVTIVISILALIFLPKLISFFFPFVVAFILSLIANPVVRFMERKIKIKRKHGSAILVVAVIAMLVGLIYLLGAILVREALRLGQDLPSIADQLSELMKKLSVRFSHIYESLPLGIQNMLSGLNKNGKDVWSQLLKNVEAPSFTKASDYLANIGNAVFMAIITILATYFMIADRDKMYETANRVFPEGIRKGYSLVVSNFKTAIGGYFKAQFKIMGILIVVMSLTFALLGIDYGLLLAIVIGLIDLLPILGTGIIFWPWAAVDFINGNYVRAVVILVLYLACQIIKQVLQPKMVGDSIGVSPFLSLLFMFIGYRLQGFIGLILGLPIGLVFVSFYRLGLFERLIRGFKIIISDINEFRKY